jgi:CheY-like chemotaxis protein
VAVGLLAKRGHDVTVANNGIEALAALERETFDVVLMDLQMPEMDGHEASAAIRDEPGLEDCTIVAVTSFAMLGDQERILAAGFDGYISNPIAPESFVTQVECFLAPELRVSTDATTGTA